MSLANFRIVIPARIGSTRLPRKPLSMLNGKPMIAHTIENAMQTGARVYVATDDPDIAQVADQIGAGVFMSIEDHNSGTERVAEVARVMRWEDDSIVVSLHGDDSTMPAVNFVQVGACLGVSGYEMVTARWSMTTTTMATTTMNRSVDLPKTRRNFQNVK